MTAAGEWGRRRFGLPGFGGADDRLLSSAAAAGLEEADHKQRWSAPLLRQYSILLLPPTASEVFDLKPTRPFHRRDAETPRETGFWNSAPSAPSALRPGFRNNRSEERRVGKECRSRWA